MKTKLKLCGIVMIVTLCFLLNGCQKADKEEGKTEKETASSGGVELDASDSESCTATEGEENSSIEADKSKAGEEDIDMEPSWKQVKEIVPNEKPIRSRFTGFLNDSFGIATFQYGILYYTVDGGETWTPGKNQSDCIAGLEIIDEKNAFITANYSEVRVSDDGGVNWRKLPNFGDMANEHCRYLSFIDAKTGWIANKKEIGYTTDGGQTWVSITVPQNLAEICAIWLSSATEGYILSSDSKLYSTTDGGKTWSEKNLNITGLKVLVCPAAVLHIDDQQTFQIIAYLENEKETGYYYLSTEDGGNSWVKNVLVSKGGPGYIYLNRDNTLLTISDANDKTIRVFEKIQ